MAIMPAINPLGYAWQSCHQPLLLRYMQLRQLHHQVGMPIMPSTISARVWMAIMPSTVFAWKICHQLFLLGYCMAIMPSTKSARVCMATMPSTISARVLIAWQSCHQLYMLGHAWQ